MASCACDGDSALGDIESIFAKYDVNKSGSLSAADLGKASWWTRLCEYVFGW